MVNMLSRFAIKRSVALWGPDAEEFGPGQWSGGEDGAATVRSNYGFLVFLEEPRECTENEFAKLKFKCLLTGTISRFAFEQDGKREGLLRRGSRKTPGGIPDSVKGVVFGSMFGIERFIMRRKTVD